MTSAEKTYPDRLSSLGCIVCLREGLGWSNPEVHHCRYHPETGRHLGMNQRAEDRHAIPLCPAHHRLGGVGVAYHAGPRLWIRLHGSEPELWAEVQRRLRVLQ